MNSRGVSMLSTLTLALTLDVDEDRELWLDPHASGAIRGAIGHALRHMHCVTLAPTCANCAHTEGCSYFGFHRGGAARGRPDEDAAARAEQAPAPWVSEMMTPAASRARVAPGQSFGVRITLLGRGVAWADATVRAAHLAARLGFSAERVRCWLRRVEVVTHDEGEGSVSTLANRSPTLVFAEDVGIAVSDTDLLQRAVRALTLDADADAPARVRLSLRTRLRLTRASVPLAPGPRDEPLAFAHEVAERLTEQGIQRLVRLVERWGDDDAALARLPSIGEYRESLGRLRAVHSTLRFDDPPARATAVRDDARRAGGLVGEVVYENVDPGLLALWRAVQVVHAGRMVALGLGALRVHVEAGATPARGG